MATVTFKHDPPKFGTKFKQGDWATHMDSLVLVTGNGVTGDQFSGVVINQGTTDLLPGSVRNDFCNNAWDVFHGKINIET